MLSEIKCPLCGVIQKKPIKTWKYSSTQVSRYKCKCGEFFNFYKAKNSTWTIPKNSL